MAKWRQLYMREYGKRRKLCQMMPNGTKWCRLRCHMVPHVPDGDKRCQIVPAKAAKRANGAKWCQVVPCIGCQGWQGLCSLKRVRTFRSFLRSRVDPPPRSIHFYRSNHLTDRGILYFSAFASISTWRIMLPDRQIEDFPLLCSYPLHGSCFLIDKYSTLYNASWSENTALFQLFFHFHNITDHASWSR